MAVNTPPTLSGGVPILGHAVEMMRDSDSLFKRGYDEHGKIFAINLGPQPAVVLTGPEYNRFFFQETDKKLNMNEGYKFLRASFGDILFTLDNETYLNQRPLLQEVFGRERMVGYVEAMNKEVQMWLDSLGENGEVNLSTEMLHLTQYVAGHALIGENFRDELGEEFWQGYQALSNSIDFVLPPNLPLPKFIKRDRAKAKLRVIMDRVIDKRRKNPDQFEDLIATLLSKPLKDGTFMPDNLIVDLFIGFLFAGHETTAGQAAWTIVELLKHPDYLALIQAEIDEHFTYGQSINGGELRYTPHIYYAIDEVTRIHPSGELLLRTASEDIELDGYTIPKGWRLFVNGVNSHNLPEVWSDPEKFDPLRWSPERNEGKDPFAIMGFGGGIHKCTGMNFAKNEMAVIIGKLFQQFELELLSTDIYKHSTGGAQRPSEARVRYRRKSPEEIAGAQSVIRA